MKLSELLAELSRVLEEEGDMPVVIDTIGNMPSPSPRVVDVFYCGDGCCSRNELWL